MGCETISSSSVVSFGEIRIGRTKKAMSKRWLALQGYPGTLEGLCECPLFVIGASLG